MFENMRSNKKNYKLDIKNKDVIEKNKILRLDVIKKN